MAVRLLLACLFQLAATSVLGAATIAFGAESRKRSLSLIQSYLVNSNRVVPLHVVTDNSSYYERIGFGASVGVRIVETKVPEGDASHVMMIKSIKTLLFQFVPDTINQLFYFDADVTIGLPLDFCYGDINRVFEARPNASLALFAEPKNGLGETHHTGVMLLDRLRSATFLAAWRVEMLSGPARDQTALVRVVRRQQFEIATLQQVTDHAQLQFVANEMVIGMRMCCFVHYTHVRMTSSSSRFNFTHDQARFYYHTVMRIDYPVDVLHRRDDPPLHPTMYRLL